MSWVQVVLFVASMLLASRGLLRGGDRPKAVGLEDIDVPTADEGRVIPILFGTRDLKSANCVWYGNLHVYQVRQRNNLGWQDVHNDLFWRTPYITFSPL